MHISILSQPISASLNTQRAATATATASTAAAPTGQVTLSSKLNQSIKQWQTNLAQFRQASQSSSSALSLRASRRDMLAQRAEMLKQRIKSLRQMMAMASPQTIKGMAQMLAQLARELKSLAGELKALSGGDNNTINFNIAASISDDSGQGSTDDASAAGVNDPGVATVDAAVSAAPDGGAETNSSRIDGSAMNAAQDKNGDSALVNTLHELAAQIKALRQLLKSLAAQHHADAKKSLKEVDKDLTDTDKALAAVDDNQSAPDPVSGVSGHIDVTA